MRKTIALVLLALIAVATYLLVDGSNPIPPPGSQSKAAFNDQSETSSGDSPVVQPRPSDNQTSESEPTAEDRWNQFAVIPTTRAQDPEEPCHRLEGEGQPICWNQLGYHPYLAYPLDTLRQMAATDAAAAEALSIRLPYKERDQKIAFALLASDLSGKSGPLYRLVSMISWSSRQNSFEAVGFLLLGDRLGSFRPEGDFRLTVLMSEYDLTREEALAEVERVMGEVRERSEQIWTAAGGAN